MGCVCVCGGGGGGGGEQYSHNIFISPRKHGKMALMLYANSAGPDQHVHPCSLIWTFSAHPHTLQYPLIL